VEYKIFGPGRQPPDDFKEDLAALFRLDDKQRDALAEWFLSADNHYPWGPELPPIIAASTLLPEQFRQTADAVRHLLYGWQRFGLQLADVERDLLLLGCGSEDMKVVLDLLKRLSSVKERVWIGALRGYQESAGLPIIDDVDIVWNARPVFGGDAYYYWAGGGDEASYNKLFGLVYLATMEIKASDSSGQKQRIAVQLTEAGLERLLVGMKRSREQLDTLKSCMEAIVPAAGILKGDR